MLRPNKRCNVCQALKTDRKLLQRIYDSKQYIKGGESLKQIARDYEGQFEYQNLYNHCKFHQGLTSEDIERKQLQRAAQQIEVQQIKQVVRHGEVRDTILEEGLRQIKAGEVKMTLAGIVAAAKHASDIEEKAKDREIEVFKMIDDFSSGAMTHVIEGEVVEQTQS